MSTQVQVDKRIVTGYNEFGFRLLARLGAQTPGKNILLSPASVALALAMTANGAKGETQREILAGLGADKLELDALNETNGALLSSLLSLDPRTELALVNSLWAAQSVPFKADFGSRNRSHYRAEITNVDFQDRTTCGRINAWVKERTNGKIDNLVKPEDCTRDTLLMLLNAIYFKGAWANPFDPAATRPGPFTLANGKRKQVSMMHRSGRQMFFEDRSFQAVSIPYGKGEISFDILLPKERGPLLEMLKGIDAKSWAKTISRFAETNIDLSLPRWKLEEEAELNQPLGDLGMKLAFTGKADFSAMTDEQAAISVVRHKSFLEVNEEGTEAAAATAVSMVRMAAFYAKPTVNVDHPFLCAIRHNSSGLLLFLGLVNDPA